MAKINNFLAATKYYDWESGFSYYGYRYYEPNTGRWLSRDPIGEKGGMNLFGNSNNDIVNKADYLSLFWFLTGCSKPKCLECVTDFEITQSSYSSRSENAMTFGHSIKIKVTASYKKASPGGTATLQWLETTDVPPTHLAALGQQPNVQFDSYGAVVKAGKNMFSTWTHRSSPSTCSGTKDYEFEDTPQIGGPFGIARTRSLNIIIKFTNPAGCPKTEVSKSLTQRLGWDGTNITQHELQ